MKSKSGLPLPPRLSMDAYADFVAAHWSRCNVEQMRRQKEMEKQIDKPFCIPSDHLLAGQAYASSSRSELRRSSCASQSFVQELQRIRNMTVEGRALEALGMADRFSWVTPVGKQQQNGQS